MESGKGFFPAILADCTLKRKWTTWKWKIHVTRIWGKRTGNSTTRENSEMVINVTRKQKTALSIKTLRGRRHARRTSKNIREERTAKRRNGISSYKSEERYQEKLAQSENRKKYTENSKCHVSGDKSETVKSFISDCSKLAEKEYKNKHGILRVVIELKLFNRLCQQHNQRLSLKKKK